MSEIDIVIPQDTNPIEIITPTATEETEVQAEETQNNTSYNVGGDAYYTDLAKDWAIKMNGKVLGQDYSSKYYAQQAKEAAEKELNMVEGRGTVDILKTGEKIIISTKTIVYTQSVASDTWEVTHNLNKRPTVTVVDSGGNTFYPPVEYTSDNVCVVHFLGATTGQAYLN